MRIPPEDTRMNVTTTAAFFSMDPGHLRRLVRRGVLPKAKRTAKNMPYYDRPLLAQMRDVLRSGVGCNGEEIAFYRRRAKPQGLPQRSGSGRRATPRPGSYIESVAEGCRQLGVGDDHLTPTRITRVLVEEFGSDYEVHALEEVIPVVVRRLQGEE